MPCDHNQSISCPCTYNCGKHGKCCECVSYHGRSGEFPACFFTPATEASYDRSYAALVRDRSKS
jgi:hypothetical protein